MINDNWKIERAPDVLSRYRQDNAIVIIKMDCDKHFFQVDGVLAEFWSKVDGKKTYKRIRSELLRKHKVPKDEFDRRIEAFINQLTELGLILDRP